MFSLFKRKSPSPPTFAARVDSFWRWFEAVAPRFHDEITAGRCATLTDETSARTSEIMPGIGWVYGAGLNNEGHSLTLTGEGDIHRQLLTLQWLAKAPLIPGWTFYAARQPGEIKGHVIETLGQRFDPAEIWVTPSLRSQDEKIDLTIWHPTWTSLNDSQKYTVAFLFLDEALGEYGTDWWIGEMKFGNDRLKDSFPLEEFAGFVERVSRDQGWKKGIPGETFTLYQTKSSTGGFPRADILTQSTAVPKLFVEFMNASGELPDPLAGTGADYVYVALPRDFFLPGEEVAGRGKIEDAIENELSKFSGGRCIGGALGAEHCYIDLLLFDGARSLNAVRSVLGEQQAPARTMIEFFAREKRGQRIAL
jgi:hypothetical protein